MPFGKQLLLFLLIAPIVVCATASPHKPHLLIQSLDAAKITQNLPITDITLGKSDNGRTRVRWTIHGVSKFEIIGNDQSNADEVAWSCGTFDKQGSFITPVPINSFCGKFFVSVLSNVISSPKTTASALLKRAADVQPAMAHRQFGNIRIETDGTYFFIRHAGSTSSLAIGISYDQVMENLAQLISMSRGHDVRGGIPRYMGQSSTHGAILEIIGQKQDITKATLLIALPKNAPKMVTQNTLLVLLFLKNIAPAWSDRADWAAAALKRVNFTGKPETVVRGNKAIKMSVYKSIGMISISVENKAAE